MWKSRVVLSEHKKGFLNGISLLLHPPSPLGKVIGWFNYKLL